MDRDSANATRLRVNRIALVQQIDTRELLPKLIRARLISADQDLPSINEGTSRIDRARRLVDCLLDKETRPANWYLLFRSILLENPSVYRKLVSTLDATVIRTPAPSSAEKADVNQNTNGDGQQDASHTQSTKQITAIEFDRYAMNKISIEGSFQKVIDNLTYHSQIPEQLFDQLSSSYHLYDREQLRTEREAYDNMRRVELMTNLMKQEPSLANQNIFDTQMVESLLNDLPHQHHYYKYFLSLSSVYGIHFDQQWLLAFQTSLSKPKDLFRSIDKGFLFYQFLYNYGRYELCRQIIESIVQVLTKQVKQQQHQETRIWTYFFRACCALVQVHNQSLEIKEAWARMEAAHEIVDNLKNTGIEITDDDHAWLYSTASQTAYEDANFDACIQYTYRGLKLANKDNHWLIVDLLCSLVQGLTSKWIMNKAQATAIMAVQYAAQYCGRNSPKYIHALQHLVQYSNEFLQDTSSVELGQYTFDRARIVYGYESLAVAHCHRSLSKSLITLASVTQSRRNKQAREYEDNESEASATDSPPSAYLYHAQEAFRIAQDWFGVEDHLRLFPFQMSLAHALQARLAANLLENKNTYFDEAMELLADCLSMAQNLFGPMSFKVAQVHRLQSATYLSNKMYKEAEDELQTCLQIYRLCLPPNSFHYLVTKASLGLLYKQQENYRQALPYFQSIADFLDTNTQSFRWINMILESLIECYSSIDAEEISEESPRARSAAEKIRSELYEWRRTNTKRLNLLNIIHQQPTRSLQQFLQDSTKFQDTTDHVHALMHLQQKAKNRTQQET